MERSRVGIIIPAYNESATIERVVREILPFGVAIVVDDASSDGTGMLAQNAGALVVRHEANRGYDAALNSGFARAVEEKLDYVVTMDADGQHSGELIGQYLKLLEEGADVVAGVRPQKARVSEKMFALTTRIRYGIHDPLCGMKGYRMSLYRAAGHFDRYGSVGTELMIFAAKKKFRIVEISVPVRKRAGGSPRYGSILKANWKIFRAMVLGMVR